MINSSDANDVMADAKAAVYAVAYAAAMDKVESAKAAVYATAYVASPEGIAASTELATKTPAYIRAFEAVTRERNK